MIRLLPLLALLACDAPGPGAAKSPGQLTTPTDSTGTNTGTSQTFTWGTEREYTLGIDDTVPPQLDLALSKAEVDDLLGSVGDDILLMELDSGPMLTSALTEIKTACGTGWMLDQADPQHNCDLTPLGQTFVGTADGTWRSSPEYAMVRILTMTPANSDVDGTSMQALRGIADFLGIGGGFGQILADSLGIARTDEFLSTEQVVASLQYNLLATHPEMNGDDRIPVTLADALSDMASLGTRFGPSGAHPGILDPNNPPHSEMLGPDFEMRVSMNSNLRVLDALDLGGGKDFLISIDDQTGPTFDDPAEFDFNDPTMFSMSGIAPNPTVDLTMKMFENNSFVPACAGDPACQGNYPGSPVGTDTVWNLDPWELEYIIAGAGWDEWNTHVHQQSYYLLFIIWVADVDIGVYGPGGWAEFSVLLDLGAPPPAQFVWELVNEVAQVNLHNNGYYSFPEGDADVQFTLSDIDVGITAQEIEDAVRPVLQEQSAEVANHLLGDYKKNSGPVDVFYRRGSDGTPALHFIASDDREDGLPYDWANPGFFGDPELTQRLSTSDGTNEVWLPPVGESTVFLQDDEGVTYRMRVFVAGADSRDEIAVLVSEAAE